MTTRPLLLCAVVYAAILTDAGAQSLNRSTVVLLVKAADYVGETYTAPPAHTSSYLFFVGEPVRVRVEIGNPGDDALTVLTPGNRPRDAFSVQSTAPIDVRMSDRVVVQHVGVGASQVLDWGPRFDIPPHQSLQIDVDLLGTLAPGEYVVDFETTVTDGDRRPISWILTNSSFGGMPTA
jgi:hypothetical protein